MDDRQIEPSTPSRPPPTSLHARLESVRKTNIIVILALAFGSVIMLGNFLGGLDTILKTVGFKSEATTITPSVPPEVKAASTVKAPIDTPAQAPAIDAVLSDGAKVSIGWSAQYDVKSSDAPVYAAEFNGMQDLKSQVGTAFKRDLLRRLAVINAKQLQATRSEIEQGLKDQLVQEFGPRGITVLDVSLGEIRPL